MGQLTIINMQEMKLCLGLNGAVMDHSYEKLGHLAKKSYVEWTWHFVSEYGMRLADDILDFPLFCTGDELLMQSFLRAGYAGKELKHLNECCLYLQVLYVSEVLTGCGTKLDVQAVRGTEQRLV
jgi:hypothetical protein